MINHTIKLSLSSKEWVQLELIRSTLKQPSIDCLVEYLVRERLSVVSRVYINGKI